MNETCIESCAPEGEGTHFDLDPNIELHEMPNYPDTDDLKPRLQFKIEKAYTRKIFEHLTGRDYEPRLIPRSRTNRQAGSRILADIPRQDLLPLATETVTVFENRKEQAHTDE
jgi:hypothetical protein